MEVFEVDVGIFEFEAGDFIVVTGEDLELDLSREDDRVSGSAVPIVGVSYVVDACFADLVAGVSSVAWVGLADLADGVLVVLDPVALDR